MQVISNKKSLIIISPFQTRSGYGQHSRLIIRSLLDNPKITNEYDIGLISLRWGSTPQTALDSNNEEDKKLLRLILQNNQLTFQPDVSIHITIPSEFQRIGKFSIGITAGTEVTVAPANFVQGCNQVDLVITPSEFTKAVLLATKVDKKEGDKVIETWQVSKPIEVLFEGLDLNIFDKNKIIECDLQKHLDAVPEKFLYLVTGMWVQGNLGQDRKDIGMVIKTFYDTFKRKKVRPGLVLKTSGAGFSITERDQIIDKIQQIQEMVKNEGFQGTLPNVYFLHGDLLDEEMNALYNHPKIKAMVSFTKGEGFGLPLLEFCTTGKPIICSAHSGPMDFLDPDYSVLLPGKLTKIDGSAANEWLPREGEWFTVNYTYSGQVLNDVFENYDKYWEKSRKYAKIAKEKFSIEKMSEKFLEILEKYNNLTNEPKKLSINLPKLKKI